MKFICGVCDWHGHEPEALRAPNPFSEGGMETMCGCPACREPNTMKTACDEPDCWRAVTCGTPTSSGYRSTCGDHAPPIMRIKPK